MAKKTKTDVGVIKLDPTFDKLIRENLIVMKENNRLLKKLDRKTVKQLLVKLSQKSIK